MNKHPDKVGASGASGAMREWRHAITPRRVPCALCPVCEWRHARVAPYNHATTCALSPCASGAMQSRHDVCPVCDKEHSAQAGINRRATIN